VRVVGDRADDAVGLGVLGDAVGTEARADRVQRVELDRRAERVTDGAAEETAMNPV